MTDNTDGTDGTAPDPTGSPSPVGRPRRLPPPLIAALVLGIALVVGVGVAGIVLGPGNSAPPAAPATPNGNATGPVLLVPVAAPKAGSAECTALLRALPDSLPNGRTPLGRRQLASPAPRAAAAWGNGVDPIVLRCGIERPPELVPTSELLAVNGVQWFQVNADGATTWYAVDRTAVVALTLPATAGTGPIQAVSDAISSTMRAVPVF